MAAIKELTRTRPQDRVFYEHVLLEHAKWFQNKIANAVEKHGLPSTEIDPETLNWFENNFCFKLQIDTDPEAVFSADMDALLSESEGNGIHTAEEIAAEKAAYLSEQGALKKDEMLEQGNSSKSVPEQFRKPEEAAQVGSEAGGSPQSFYQPSDAAPETDISPTGSRFFGAPKGKGTLK